VTHRAHGEVVSVKHTGAFSVSINREAFESIGVKLGRRFQMSIGEGPHAPPFHVLNATLTEYPYKGVEDYCWFGDFDAEHEWLCMHLKTFEYCNGAKALGIVVGTPVTAEAVELPAPRAGRKYTDTLAKLRVPGGVLDGHTGRKGKGTGTGSGRPGGKGKGIGKHKGKGKVWVERAASAAR